MPKPAPWRPSANEQHTVPHLGKLVDVAFQPVWPAFSFQGDTYSGPVHAYTLDDSGLVSRITLTETGKIVQIRPLQQLDTDAEPKGFTVMDDKTLGVAVARNG